MHFFSFVLTFDRYFEIKWDYKSDRLYIKCKELNSAILIASQSQSDEKWPSNSYLKLKFLNNIENVHKDGIRLVSFLYKSIVSTNAFHFL